MKKRVMTIVLMLAVLLSAAGCKKKEETEKSGKKTKKTTETSETETDTEPEPSTSETSEPTEPSVSETQDPNGFRFTEENYPIIDGSTSTKPMATAITSIMLGIPRGEADGRMEFHKTTQSFSYLMDGSADMLICAQPADSVFEMMDEANFEYEMEAFAAEALVFAPSHRAPSESPEGLSRTKLLGSSQYSVGVGPGNMYKGPGNMYKLSKGLYEANHCPSASHA